MSILSRLAARRPLPPCPVTASPVRVPIFSPLQYAELPLSPRSCSPETYSDSSSPRVPFTTMLNGPSTFPVPHSRPTSPPWTAAEHACGWSAECDKLKRQIDDVQIALADLRCDFERAVTDKRLGTDQTQAPAAQTAATGGTERPSGAHSSSSLSPPRFPPGFVPNPIPSSIQSWCTTPFIPPMPRSAEHNPDTDLSKIESTKLPDLTVDDKVRKSLRDGRAC